MPEIEPSSISRVEHPTGRRRKRGTSIIPHLPDIPSPGQDEPVAGGNSQFGGSLQKAGNKSDFRSGQHPSLFPLIDSGNFIQQQQQRQQQQHRNMAPQRNSFYSKDNSKYKYNKVSAYLMRQPSSREMKMSPSETDNSTSSSVQQWLETVDSSALPEDVRGMERVGINPGLGDLTEPFLLDTIQDRPRAESERTDITLLPPIKHLTRRLTEDPVTMYRRACKLQKVTPVDRFIKQIGRRRIDLRNHLLGPADIKGISTAVAIQASAEELDVSGNNIGPQGTRYLAETVQAISKISVLAISSTFPDVEGCRCLSKALQSNDCLRILNLAENDLGERHAVQLCGYIRDTRTLRELYLNHNRLDEAGGQLIGSALAWNKSIQVLDLTWNHLRRSGAEAICKALKVNTTLEKLNVSWNGFSIEGCKCLSKILPKNDTLRHLDLSSNRINSRALLFFLKGLVKNEGITSLKIGKNPFTTEAAITIIETLTACDFCSVDDLDISDVPVDEEFLAAVERLREKRIVSIRHGPLYRLEEVKQGEVANTLGLERFDPVLVLYEYMKQDSMRLVDMFHYFDVDQNGYISLAEFREGFANANIPLTEDGLEQLVKKIDNDRDGKIDLQELMVGHRKFSRTIAERNRIAKIHHKPEDASIRDLREIIKKFLYERNEKFKETKSDTEGKTGSLKTSQKVSQSSPPKSRRPSRRSRTSTVKPPIMSTSIPEEDEGDVLKYLHALH